MPEPVTREELNEALNDGLNSLRLEVREMFEEFSQSILTAVAAIQAETARSIIAVVKETAAATACETIHAITTDLRQRFDELEATQKRDQRDALQSWTDIYGRLDRLEELHGLTEA